MSEASPNTPRTATAAAGLRDEFQLLAVGLVTLATGVTLAAFVSPAGVLKTLPLLVIPSFVYVDVLIVSVMAMSPFTAAVTRQITGRFPAWVCLLIGITLGVIACLMCRPVISISGSPHATLAASGFPARLLASFLIAGCSQLIPAPWLVSRLNSEQRNSVPKVNQNWLQLRWMLFSLVTMVGLPAIWIEARCQYELQDYQELRQQSRLQDAKSVLQKLLVLAPDLRSAGSSLKSELRLLSAEVDALQTEASRELPAEASTEVLLQRARQFAMLARVSEAEAILQSRMLSDHAEALMLQGQIHENQDDWLRAVEFYNLADQSLRTTDDPATAELREQLLMSRAFCSRRLGRIPDAERDYLTLLQSNPSAENHFLLARFYDDIQNSAAAQHHVLAATTLDPNAYAEPGRRLIQNLQTTHFGCFSVYWRSLNNP
jgi:tetratricopeptide (TPR) repeat protein